MYNLTELKYQRNATLNFETNRNLSAVNPIPFKIYLSIQTFCIILNKEHE